MNVSARNQFSGRIKSLSKGTVTAEVVVEVASGVEVVASITRASADRLELAEGKEVYALLKASDVMIATD